MSYLSIISCLMITCYLLCSYPAFSSEMTHVQDNNFSKKFIYLQQKCDELNKQHNNSRIYKTLKGEVINSRTFFPPSHSPLSYHKEIWHEIEVKIGNGDKHKFSFILPESKQERSDLGAKLKKQNILGICIFEDKPTKFQAEISTLTIFEEPLQ